MLDELKFVIFMSLDSQVEGGEEGCLVDPAISVARDLAATVFEGLEPGELEPVVLEWQKMRRNGVEM